MDELGQYYDDDDSNHTGDQQQQSHGQSAAPALMKRPIASAPSVSMIQYDAGAGNNSGYVPSNASQIMTNPKAEELWTPLQGPSHPIRERQALVPGQDQTLAGATVRPDGIDEFTFESQYNTYKTFGYAYHPAGNNTLVGDRSQAPLLGYESLASASGQAIAKEMKKRKREDAEAQKESVAAITERAGGPYSVKPAVDTGELTEAQIEYRKKKGLSIPESAQQKKGSKKDPAGNERNREVKKQKNDAVTEQPTVPEENSREGMSIEQTHTVFHGKEYYDYQGRSWMEPPKGLHPDEGDHRCYPPKKCIHTFRGHGKGVQCIRFFPLYGHLLLSGGLDGKIKIWDVHSKACMRTYIGHTAGIRDLKFTADGKHFLSCSYDGRVKYWDTESGKCLSDFDVDSTPYCLAIHPVEQNVFLVGLQNSHVVQYDINTGEVVQDYFHHLKRVNSIVYVENGDRFVSTSDDRTMLVWEAGIPVPIKYISDPEMHSIPATALHPKGQYFVGQSLNNTIVTYSAQNRFNLNPKKEFTGHINAGFACELSFSPNGQYLISGSSDGNVFIWDWRHGKPQKRYKGHNGVCISTQWHPLEPSLIATAGWDASIKLWQ
eukprot:gb/GECG01014648.1/.p1 GENE.gb/GECG01014648.1/~~gb/GECG01014648.1/.p1  ORF type:complete len:603 (+),score=81.51 gb/GECG01014648.1/:1-1809(+)